MNVKVKLNKVHEEKNQFRVSSFICFDMVSSSYLVSGGYEVGFYFGQHYK